MTILAGNPSIRLSISEVKYSAQKTSTVAAKKEAHVISKVDERRAPPRSRPQLPYAFLPGAGSGVFKASLKSNSGSSRADEQRWWQYAECDSRENCRGDLASQKHANG